MRFPKNYNISCIIINKMLTGIVKIAQIDDYISPSQSCIQPKIMKPDVTKQKATVSLNDCLACSGCITSAESVLIQQMSIEKFIQITKTNNQVAIMIAPQTLLSLARFYQLSPDECFKKINVFFMRNFKSVVGVFEMSTAIQIGHQLIMEEFMQRVQSKETPVLCSQCPGWVCYSQKTLTQKITNLLSHVKSPQQIMSNILKQKYGKNCRIVSIMPCYDKKLEAIRFQLDDKVKQVDLTMATIEFVELVKKIQNSSSEPIFNKTSIKEQMSTNQGQEKIKNKCESGCESGCQKGCKNKCNKQQIEAKRESPNQLKLTKPQKSQLKFIKDQTSNGYIQFILDRLEIKNYTCEQIKNSSDYKQYSFQWQGNKFKMAKCYGFKNIQKVVQMIKKDKCPYLYVEIMACPGGCFGGGGQIRYEGIKNKEIFVDFENAILDSEIISGCRPKSKVQINTDNLYFKYKPIQKNLMQAVLNW